MGKQAEPEFVRLSDLEARFGLKRSLVYRLIGEGKIRWIAVKKGGPRMIVPSGSLVHAAERARLWAASTQRSRPNIRRWAENT